MTVIDLADRMNDIFAPECETGRYGYFASFYCSQLTAGGLQFSRSSCLGNRSTDAAAHHKIGICRVEDGKRQVSHDLLLFFARELSSDMVSQFV